MQGASFILEDVSASYEEIQKMVDKQIGKMLTIDGSGMQMDVPYAILVLEIGGYIEINSKVKVLK